MMTFLLIVHGLIAVALLGGITHQTFAACWPARRKDGFFTSFRAVAGTRYTNANIVLYLVAATLGGIIYSSYRITVRIYLENARLTSANGAFEVKEQFVAVGLGMLPLFWWVWREPLDPAKAGARAAVTAILCFIVWYSFLTGHVLNNIRGLFGQ
jgi:hypothetical protein